MIFDALTLRCFLEVADGGSFTRTAERVGRSQSAVSQQIAKLEDLLGKRLVARGKTVSLTADGQIFLAYARRIHDLQREALDRFREPDLEGEVRFGLPEDFASVYLSGVLAEFARIHPRILLSIECDLTVNLFNRFKSGDFDLVLVKMNRPEDFPNGVDVLDEPLAWVGDPTLVAGNGPLPLVLAPQPCVYRAAALRTLEGAGLRWRQALVSPSHAGTIAAVRAGLGLTVLPRPMIPDRLSALPAGLLPSPGDIHVSMLKHETGNSVINSLEDFVLRRFRN
ncbi:LysR substrate-binding domain-containing protein [Devosia sp.]|uniref:LysR substrate-binding domain-containing protein n=1 Tax=Devosia sp. TaxID=1871048 RepID=UPI003BAA9150